MLCNNALSQELIHSLGSCINPLLKVDSSLLQMNLGGWVLRGDHGGDGTKGQGLDEIGKAQMET